MAESRQSVESPCRLKEIISSPAGRRGTAVGHKFRRHVRGREAAEFGNIRNMRLNGSVIAVSGC